MPNPMLKSTFVDHSNDNANKQKQRVLSYPLKRTWGDKYADGFIYTPCS